MNLPTLLYVLLLLLNFNGRTFGPSCWWVGETMNGSERPLETMKIFQRKARHKTWKTSTSTSVLSQLYP